MTRTPGAVGHRRPPARSGSALVEWIETQAAILLIPGFNTNTPGQRARLDRNVRAWSPSDRPASRHRFGSSWSAVGRRSATRRNRRLLRHGAKIEIVPAVRRDLSFK